MTATQTTIASSEVPQSVDEADKLLQQHHVTKLEIDNYAVSNARRDVIVSDVIVSVERLSSDRSDWQGSDVTTS